MIVAFLKACVVDGCPLPDTYVALGFLRECCDNMYKIKLKLYRTKTSDPM